MLLPVIPAFLVHPDNDSHRSTGRLDPHYPEPNMGFFRSTPRETNDWQQRLTLASEFELSMAGFGLMGEPGSFAERILLSEVRSARDADRRVSADRMPLPTLACGAQA